MNYGKEFIGANIKRYRSRKNMTQEQLAEKLGVNRQTVGRWENGSLEPRTKKLSEIAKALGVSKFDLYADEELTRRRTFIDEMAINYVEEHNETFPVLTEEELAYSTRTFAVERCNATLRKLNYEGVNKVTEYAELLATQEQYANSDKDNGDGKQNEHNNKK